MSLEIVANTEHGVYLLIDRSESPSCQPAPRVPPVSLPPTLPMKTTSTAQYLNHVSCLGLQCLQINTRTLLTQQKQRGSHVFSRLENSVGKHPCWVTNKKLSLTGEQRCAGRERECEDQENSNAAEIPVEILWIVCELVKQVDWNH